MKSAYQAAISALVLSLSFLMPFSASAQSWGPRTLPQLKAEAQRRADGALPPVDHVKPADMREALAQINSLEPDEWAKAFIAIGDSYCNKHGRP